MPRLLPVLAFFLVLAACNSDPNEPDVPRIEDTDFDPSLDVDLSAMTETPSGLYYRDLEEGSGAEATTGSEVSVRYTGWLPDGRQFDSNEEAEDPFTFQLGTGSVIPGFDEGVTGMRVGGSRQVIIPPELGYGNQPVGAIPPNSILVFTIQLEDVEE